MAEKTVVVRYIARGSRQVGRQVLGMAKAHSAAAGEMAGANSRAALSAKGLATASAIMGKVILLGIGAALAVSTKAAIDFEASMAEVAKTLDFDLHSEEYEMVADALLKMSETTPVNVNELAQIAAIGGQLGIPIENIVDFTEVIAAMGVSTNLSTQEAAKGMARFMNVMGTSYDDFERIGSIIVDLGNNFATTESEILTFATRLAPIGSIVGATEEEVLGLATAFSQMGVPAERGATAIQRVFIDIERAVEGGGEKLMRYAQAAGVSVDEFVSASAVDRLHLFIDGLARVEDEGGSALTTLKNLNINQQRTIAVLLAAASNADGFADALETANKAGEESSALYEEAAKRYGTTASQIQLMANAFNALRIELGGSFINAAQGMVNFLRDLFAGLRDNIGAFKAFLMVLGGIATAKIILAIAGAFIHLKDAMVGMAAAGGIKGMFSGLGMVSKLTAALPGIAGAATLAFAGLAYAWGQNAKKAREFEESVDMLADALEDTTTTDFEMNDVVEEILDRGGVNIKRLRDELNSLGVPLSDFFKAWQGGSEDFDAFVSTLIAKKPLLEEFFATGFGANNTAVYDEAGRILPVSYERADIVEFYSGIRDAVKLGERIVAGEEEEAAKRRRDAYLARDQLDPFRAKLLDSAMGLKEANRIASLSFFEVVAASDDSLDAWNDYYEDVQGGMEDLVEAIDEGFQDIEDDVLGMVDPWSEAFEATEVVTADWIANLEAQVAAVEGWTRLMAESDISAGVRAEMENWSLAEKAWFTTLSEQNPEEATEVLDALEGYYGPEGRLTAITEFLQNNSGVVGAAVVDFFSLTVENFEELKAAGVDPVEAWERAVADALELVPEELKPEVAAALNALASEHDVLKDDGAAVVDGFINGMRSREEALRFEARRLGDVVEQSIGAKLEMQSPSKVMEQMGRYVVQGFNNGMRKEAMNTFPNMPAGGGIGSYLSPQAIGSNLSVTGGGGTTVNVIRPETNDLAGDISEGLTRASISEQVDLIGAY